MIEVLGKIISNILVAFYQPFWFAVTLSVLVMFFYLFAEKYGCRPIIKEWLQRLKTDLFFRRIFLLVFYVTMILFRTLLNRNMWANPVSNVIGIWGVHNKKGEFTTEVIENILLFIPLMFLLFWVLKDKILKKTSILYVALQSVNISFLFSLTIEFLQLFLRLGTFQLSDLFFNTLGGFVGGMMYWIGYKVKHRD